MNKEVNIFELIPKTYDKDYINLVEIDKLLEKIQEEIDYEDERCSECGHHPDEDEDY